MLQTATRRQLRVSLLYQPVLLFTSRLNSHRLVKFLSQFQCHICRQSAMPNDRSVLLRWLCAVTGWTARREHNPSSFTIQTKNNWLLGLCKWLNISMIVVCSKEFAIVKHFAIDQDSLLLVVIVSFIPVSPLKHATNRICTE